MNPTDAKVKNDSELASSAITRLESIAYRLRYERDQARHIAKRLANSIKLGTEPPKDALGRSYDDLAQALPEPTE